MLANNAFLGAPLKEIVAQELTSFSDQVTVTGCDIAVNTRAAESFALIIHELATNAVKYGALSTRQGRVAIQCSIDGANGSGQFRARRVSRISFDRCWLESKLHALNLLRRSQQPLRSGQCDPGGGHLALSVEHGSRRQQSHHCGQM